MVGRSVLPTPLCHSPSEHRSKFLTLLQWASVRLQWIMLLLTRLLRAYWIPNSIHKFKRTIRGREHNERVAYPCCATFVIVLLRFLFIRFQKKKKKFVERLWKMKYGSRCEWMNVFCWCGKRLYVLGLDFAVSFLSFFLCILVLNLFNHIAINFKVF